MQDTSKFTVEQKRAVSRLRDWENFSIHSNGDVTVRAGGKNYRLTKKGVIIDSWGGLGGETLPKTQSELGWGIPQKIEKKPTALPIPSKLPPAKLPVKSSKAEKKYEYKSYPSKTICQESPECCKPREIKGVFWDADHTIWDMEGTAAAVTGELKKIDDNTVVELSTSGKYSEPYYETKESYGYKLTDTEEKLLEGLSPDEKDFLIEELVKEHGAVSTPVPKPKEKTDGKQSVRTTIKLDPTFRETLSELEKRNIPSSIISLNTPGSVKRILKEFGLDHRFVEIRDSYVNKGNVFKELTKKQGICPCDGMFVDDSSTNTVPVFEKCGMAIQIGKSKDIERTIEIMKYIRNEATK